MALTFEKSWTLNGTPTEATSATIGIYDDTSGLQVLAPGTAMENPSTGQYLYKFLAALSEHSYTATIVVTYLGQTYTFTATAQATESTGERERGERESTTSSGLSARTPPARGIGAECRRQREKPSDPRPDPGRGP